MVEVVVVMKVAVAWRRGVLREGWKNTDLAESGMKRRAQWRVIRWRRLLLIDANVYLHI